MWTGGISARQSRRFAPELPGERTISWPAGARTRGYRADLPPQPLAWGAWVPAEAGDQGRAAAGAWRIPRPAAPGRAGWMRASWAAVQGGRPVPSAAPPAGSGAAQP